MKFILIISLVLLCHSGVAQIPMRVNFAVSNNLNVLEYSKSNEFYQNLSERTKAASIKVSHKTVVSKSSKYTFSTEFNIDGTIKSDNNGPYKFDSLNRLLEIDARQIIFTDSLIDTIGFISQIQYFEDSIIMGTINFEHGDSMFIKIYRKFYFDIKGILLKEVSYYVNKRGVLHNYFTKDYKFEFDERGRFKNLTFLDSRLAISTSPLICNYYYSVDQKIIRYNLGPDNRYKYEKLYNEVITTYDSLNNPIKIEYNHNINLDDKKKKNNSYSYQIYDKMGNVTESLTYEGKKLYSTYKYDDYGNVLENCSYKMIFGLVKWQYSVITYSYEKY